MTLRLTSPQAAIVSSIASFIAWIAGRRLLLMMPWNWMVWRVVRRIVPLPRSRAMRLGRQPLLRRQNAARHAHPRHEDEGLLHLLAPAFGAQVAVVLQVDAVELCQLLVVVGQRAGFHARSPSAIVPRRKRLFSLMPRLARARRGCQ